jgi:hypothetical protein
MLIDCKAIKNITVKYRYHIPRLNYMLDEFHGSYCFLKLILKMDIIKLEKKKVMNEKLFLKLNMICMSG